MVFVLKGHKIVMFLILVNISKLACIKGTGKLKKNQVK
jgi:hypothetical protein